MRKSILFLSALALLTVFSVCAFAGGYLPWAANKKDQVQNLKAIAPAADGSRCDTVTGTSAVLKNYTASGYLGISANAYHPTTGAPIVVKWKEDGKQVWTGSSYEATNNKGTAISQITGAAFSNRTTAFCVRRQ